MSDPQRITGAEAMLTILRNYNIEYLFASPGSEWPPLWEQLAKQNALGQSGPHYINTRHENLAIGMAMGYTKVTGRLPVVLLHTTVGALTALVDLVREEVVHRADTIHQRTVQHGARNQQRRQGWSQEALANKNRQPIDTRWLCYELNQLLPPETVVSTEMASILPLAWRG
jgi:thiamine pyrophosphate-dependent acetolactate synthase large subunit-like protein